MPLYHRPDPLPPLLVHRRSVAAFFQKAPASRRLPNPDVQPRPDAKLLYAGVLAGAAGAVFFFTMLALTLGIAGMVWGSPHRAVLLSSLGLAFLAATFTTARVLWKRVRAWRPLNGLQTRLQRDTADLGSFLESAGPGHARRANDLC